MPENDKNDQKPQPGTDDKRDKTLTEKEEEKAGGENKKTPGPVYDVSTPALTRSRPGAGTF